MPETKVSICEAYPEDKTPVVIIEQGSQRNAFSYDPTKEQYMVTAAKSLRVPLTFRTIEVPQDLVSKVLAEAAIITKDPIIGATTQRLTTEIASLLKQIGVG